MCLTYKFPRDHSTLYVCHRCWHIGVHCYNVARGLSLWPLLLWVGPQFFSVVFASFPSRLLDCLCLGILDRKNRISGQIFWEGCLNPLDVSRLSSFLAHILRSMAQKTQGNHNSIVLFRFQSPSFFSLSETFGHLSITYKEQEENTIHTRIKYTGKKNMSTLSSYQPVFDGLQTAFTNLPGWGWGGIAFNSP